MSLHYKLLTVFLIVAGAIILLAGCSFPGGPSFGQPPADTSAAATPTPIPASVPATAVGSVTPTLSQPGSAGPATPQIGGGSGTTKRWPEPPAMVIDTTVPYTAIINTSAGPITVELLTGDAPNTVNNFVFLAREGFYDNLIFHRAIEGFMIQGGDPTGTGGGGPGYRFADEPVKRPYSRGVMAMANAGPHTNGSQFFLMHADYNLPPSYTIFGQAVSGLETIDAIATAPKQQGGEGSKPVTPVVIQSVQIVGP